MVVKKGDVLMYTLRKDNYYDADSVYTFSSLAEVRAYLLERKAVLYDYELYITPEEISLEDVVSGKVYD
jgi:hypothetical protein